VPDEAALPAPGFELTEHTADVGVRAWGPGRTDVFAQAARGMLSLVCEPATVTARERYVVEVEAFDESLLLAAWLNELLYLVEGRRVVFSGEFEIEVLEEAAAGGRQSQGADGLPSEAGGEGAQVTLRALAVGEPYDPARHELRAAVKAATLHRLSLHEVAGGWEGHVLLDV
jgi:tRNA nucleotidyltransferase (CCA-adding enzyme)